MNPGQDFSTPYHLAYTAIVVIYGAYGVSLWWRARRLKRRNRR